MMLCDLVKRLSREITLTKEIADDCEKYPD